MYAVDLARRGKLGKLQTRLRATGRVGDFNERLGARRTGAAQRIRSIGTSILGPAAWRPFNNKWLDAFNFEKGGGLTGGGCLEWGSHCVDLCQWANDADNTAPVEYEPRRRRTSRALRQRREAGHARQGLDRPLAPARFALKATPAGSKPGTTAIWWPAPPRCWPTNARKFRAIRQTSTCATFWIASRAGRRRARQHRGRLRRRTLPVMPPTLPCSFSAK